MITIRADDETKQALRERMKLMGHNKLGPFLVEMGLRGTFERSPVKFEKLEGIKKELDKIECKDRDEVIAIAMWVCINLWK